MLVDSKICLEGQGACFALEFNRFFVRFKLDLVDWYWKWNIYLWFLHWRGRVNGFLLNVDCRLGYAAFNGSRFWWFALVCPMVSQIISGLKELVT